jgi:hypothetical protein
VEFEPTIPVFGRAKAVHALDRRATVIGIVNKIVATKIQVTEKTVKILSSGIQRLVVRCKSTHVSEKYVVSIFRVSSACYLLHDDFLHDLFFGSDDGGAIFFRKIG